MLAILLSVVVYLNSHMCQHLLFLKLFVFEDGALRFITGLTGYLILTHVKRRMQGRDGESG